MAQRVELLVMRRQTAEYIKREPVVLTLQRNQLVSDGQGGWTPTAGPIPAGKQTFAFDAMGRVQAGHVRRTVDGQEVEPEYALMGKYDADVQRGDWFFIEGIKYEVVFVHPDRSYEVSAEVAYRG